MTRLSQLRASFGIGMYSMDSFRSLALPRRRELRIALGYEHVGYRVMGPKPAMGTKPAADLPLRRQRRGRRFGRGTECARHGDRTTATGAHTPEVLH